MRLVDHKGLYSLIVAILAFIVVSPTLARFLVFPRSEFFTEAWILGSNHKAEYPYNVPNVTDYSVFLGLGNQLGYSAYYLVEVKLRNDSQAGPQEFGPVESRLPSNLTSLYDITAFVADQGVWEVPLTFSFNYGLDQANSSVLFRSMRFNDVTLDLSSESVVWNATLSKFRIHLFFEVWLYDALQNGFQYHGRDVGLVFNMTA